jgi:hypothetical protein
MRPLNISGRAKFLAAGAAVVAAGLGSGGAAWAAASGGAPALSPAGGVRVLKIIPARPVLVGRAPVVIRTAGGDCSGLSLTEVPGVPAPTVTGTETPTPVDGQPVICGAGGVTGGVTTAGR